jgi:hypothetical protein
MPQEIDTLRDRIEQDLKSGGFIVFRGYPRIGPPESCSRWDAENYPDPADFLSTASRLGIRLISFCHRPFDKDMLDRAIQDAEDGELPQDMRRDIMRTLKKLRMYEGFTCSLEISFEHNTRPYIYTVFTSWYEQFLQAMNEVDEWNEAGFDDIEEDMPGGFLSQN